MRLSSPQGCRTCTPPQGLHDASGRRPRFQTVHSSPLLLLAASGQSYSLTFIHAEKPHGLSPSAQHTVITEWSRGFCPSQTKFFILLSICGSISQFPTFTIKITWPKHYWTKPKKVQSWRLQAFESKHMGYAAPAPRFIQKCSTLNTVDSFFRERPECEHWEGSGEAYVAETKEDGTQIHQASSPWTNL